jgi:hypothetical protein
MAHAQAIPASVPTILACLPKQVWMSLKIADRDNGGRFEELMCVFMKTPCLKPERKLSPRRKRIVKELSDQLKIEN